MTLSFSRILGALGVVTVATTAVPNSCSDNSASSASRSASAPAPASAARGGPGLPRDFPLAPGVSACAPLVINHEVICDWHGVDTRAVYDFYQDALPKAGYTLSGNNMFHSAPHASGQLSFKKGDVTGAILVLDSDLKIEVITPP